MAFLNIAPTGTVLPFAGSTAPEGWALCNAGAISRTNYSALFAVIGTTYGTGDGSTTFNLPDMQGVFPRGAGTNGTGNYGGVTGHTPAGGALAGKGGQKTAKNGLSSAFTGSSATSGNESVDHSHSGTTGGNNDNSAGGSYRVWHSQGIGVQAFGQAGATGAPMYEDDERHSHNFGTGGRSAAHTHVVTATGSNAVSSTDTETTPAFLALNYIIKL